MSKYIGSIDQGTTSTRFLLFTKEGKIAYSRQLEHKQYYPKPGWVEHDPLEIWTRTQQVIRSTLTEAGISGDQVQSIGITNQRETTVAWNPQTGHPYGRAIVWQDVRTESFIQDIKAQNKESSIKNKTGLPLATYFSGSKINWMIENNKELQKALSRGEVLFGTMDTYITWWLTGGPQGGSFVTDITNASRTLLMDIHTLTWDKDMMDTFGVKEEYLPRIYPSVPSSPFGFTTKDGPFQAQVPIGAILGDQQAALFGQTCYERGDCKNTYGTGAFLLVNTGTDIVKSTKGLITTPAYQLGNSKPIYALEGSVAIAGSLVQWIRDNLGFIEKSDDIETLALSVEDSGGVYIVPAFSGLFAPYWRPDARGVITGLTGYVNSGHLARAVLEATAFQSKEIFDAMSAEANIDLGCLKVDGGMTNNHTLMQFQSDILNVPVIRPQITETTALGVAYAAGLSSSYWHDKEQIKAQWHIDCEWSPQMDAHTRSYKYKYWQKAVSKTLDWEDL
ncbi:glycerol kinase GlpK [Spirochaeta cellobiosiphila]|uniref:glycerol kinase GlpK n=1 Tax=Spirochaeta cellobiosiphila TaxID=504483 RepID=UPI0003FA7E89|nr:glycerol kinase GlpK [Spirochaeta cellobiosiphila]